MIIERNQVLDVSNLISMRKKLTASQLQEYAAKMTAYIETHGAKRDGGSITATYAVEGDKIDMEVYLPIDREIPSCDEFVFKPRLYLENCLKIMHKGNPQLIDVSMKKLNDYIEINGLMPITVGFIRTLKEATSMKELEFFEADVFISICPNIV